MNIPPPLQVSLSKDRKKLNLSWPNQTVSLSAPHLRRNSPSAEVKGHFGQGGKVPENVEHVTLTNLQPVGNYALQIFFSDGHQSGFFTWSYLHSLAQESEQK